MKRSILVTILIIGGMFLFEVVQALTVSPVKFEISGSPGQRLLGELELFNEQEETRTFYSSFENFEARGETGTPYFTPGKEDLATWIEAPAQVTLEPRERKTVPFSIQVPQNAEPGGHFAAIFWGTTPPQAKEGGQVAVGAKTGVLILLTVSGEIKGGGGLLEFSTKDKEKFFDSLPINFFYRFQNTSTDRIKPDGEIEIKNTFGKVSAVLPANKVEGNVLPRSIRKFEVIWETQNKAKVEETLNQAKTGFFEKVKKQWKDFHFGRYTANLNLTYGPKNETAKASFSFFIIPWQLLILIIILLAVIIILGGMGIKRYNRWIITKALKERKTSEKT
jgi:hypothetical protein